MAEVKEVRQLVGDDHGGAGPRDPGHLAKRHLGVVEMVEPAVAQHGVELPVTEGHVLSFAENEPEIAAGVTALAGGELVRGDVEADDRPVLGEPARVDAVAYGDVEQAEAGRPRQVSQDRVARPPLAAVEDPEYTLPEPDFRPELAVVKVGRDLVVVGRGVADDEHAVANGEARAAPFRVAVEAGVRPVQGAVAARAAERSGVGRPGARRFAGHRRHRFGPHVAIRQAVMRDTPSRLAHSDSRILRLISNEIYTFLRTAKRGHGGRSRRLRARNAG